MTETAVAVRQIREALARIEALDTLCLRVPQLEGELELERQESGRLRAHSQQLNAAGYAMCVALGRDPVVPIDPARLTAELIDSREKALTAADEFREQLAELRLRNAELVTTATGGTVTQIRGTLVESMPWLNPAQISRMTTVNLLAEYIHWAARWAAQ